MTVNSEESPEQPRQLGSTATDTRVDPGRVESSILRPDNRDYGDYGRDGRLDAQPGRPSSGRAPAEDLSLGLTGPERQAELTEQGGPRELRGPDGPRQLPPAE